jgi:uncharacterized protein (DUF885 family)
MKYLILLAVVTFFSCQKPNINTQFDSTKEQFIEDFWVLNPGYATYVGYHAYDSVLIIPNQEYNNKLLAFCEKYTTQLKQFDLALLSDNNKTDYYIIENLLSNIIWELKDHKPFEWQPSQYNLGGIFFEILKYDQQPLEERLINISKKLEKVPAYYQAAKINLSNATIEHTDLAILQNNGSLPVFEINIKDSIEHSQLDAQTKTAIHKNLDAAVTAIKGYVSWLQNDLMPSITNSARSFRLGKELYDKKFEYDIQATSTAEQIYQKALQTRDEVHEQMKVLTNELWPKYFGKKSQPDESLKATKQLIEKIAQNHVHRDSFITAIKTQIPELTNFVNEKDLLYLDPDKPLVVRETPLYMRGIAGASIQSPGPYDKNAETFYNVTPLDEMDDKQAESYLREYNYYILQILNIHEAIPGHYAQLVYSNQSPSLIKSIFGNGTMIEGWAVYAERMMLEEGYNSSPEMWLMYNKWYLRVICNTILDYEVHVLNMSEEEALDLLMNQAFQERTEAVNKWRRVQLTSVQLCSYFTGFSEIYSLREELKERQKEKFNLRQFHEKFLSYGSAPVRYIRELMLKEL